MLGVMQVSGCKPSVFPPCPSHARIFTKTLLQFKNTPLQFAITLTVFNFLELRKIALTLTLFNLLGVRNVIRPARRVGSGDPQFF